MAHGTRVCTNEIDGSGEERRKEEEEVRKEAVKKEEEEKEGRGKKKRWPWRKEEGGRGKGYKKDGGRRGGREGNISETTAGNGRRAVRGDSNDSDECRGRELTNASPNLFFFFYWLEQTA